MSDGRPDRIRVHDDSGELLGSIYAERERLGWAAGCARCPYAWSAFLPGEALDALCVHIDRYHQAISPSPSSPPPPSSGPPAPGG